MPRIRKTDRERVWWVDHPDHTVAVVRATGWEQATVEAAEWWEVPWREVAALCECIRVEKILHNICVDCGTLFNDTGTRCERCMLIARDLERSIRASGKQSYREALP